MMTPTDRALDASAAEALVDRYLAFHAATDLEGVLALFAANASVEDPVGSPRHHGREAIRAFYQQTQATNGRLVIERVGPALVCGGEVALHVRARLESADEGSGMDVIYTIRLDEEGQIASLRAFF